MKTTSLTKSFYIGLGIFLLLCACFACEATPEEDFVPNKCDYLLQQAIYAPAESTEQPAFPLSLTKDIVIRENGLLLSINAEIKLPTVNKFPAVKVIPKCVELAEIETVLGYISSNYYLGTPLLDDSTFEGLTKQEILNELTKNQWEIDHIDELIPGSEEAREDHKASLELRNKNLTEAYPSAPILPIPLNLSTLETIEGSLPQIFIYSDNIKRGKLLYSAGGAENDVRGSTLIIDAMDDESLQPIGASVFDSLDMLIEFSESLITKLYPSQPYALNRTIETECMYGAVYMPSYEGVPYIHTTGYEGASESGASYGGGEFSFYWPDDRICIYAYKDTNFLRAFERYSPTAAGEVLNENVQLLDFNRIERAFENYIVSNYSWYDDEIIAQTIVIDDIGLGMKRIPIIDGEGYMVIPAWYFAGHLVSKYDPENCPYTDLDENNERVEEFDKEGVVAMINAVDGTILD